MEKSEAIYIRLSENERKQIKEKMEIFGSIGQA